MKTSVLSVIFLLSAFCANAQKVEKVQGEYVYHAPENVTLEQAKRTALERAKLKAIADVFGTVVSQSNSTVVKNEDGKSSTDFLSLGGSEVKGEWIETIGEPEYTIGYEQNMLVVKVEVRGRIREIVRSKVDVETAVLCNGTSPADESSYFTDGDDMYLYFKSPVNGYLTVYLLDETTQQVFCLLPYKRSGVPSYSIRHDKSYLFFSAKESENTPDEVDEYTMTCSRQQEQNTIYVIFSPNRFAKANTDDSSATLPRELSYKDFQRWLHKQTVADEEMIAVRKMITVKRRK